MEPRHLICPRCGAAFVCTHDIHCQCVGVHLSAAARAYITANYNDCLCHQCLEQIAEAYPGD